MLNQEIKFKDENIVANLSLFNPYESDRLIDASIDVSLEKPILKRCSDYKLTIIRFRIPLDTIYPAFTFEKLNFNVTLRFNNSFYPATINVSTPIYSINEFLANINTLFYAAYALLSGNYPSRFPYRSPPYILLNQDRFSLVVPVSFYDPTTGNPDVVISVSDDLFYYIGGLPAKPSVYDQQYYDLYLFVKRPYLSPDYDINGIAVQTSTSGLTKYNSYIIDSEFSTGFRFNNIQSIILTSNIPTRQEQLPLISNNLVNSNISYISTFSILNDFSIHIERFGQQYETLIYYPQSQFRWIDLISDGQLDRLSFTFWYQRNDQTIHKIMIKPGDSCNIKLYFVNKKASF
jgi:hypothetical protein